MPSKTVSRILLELSLIARPRFAHERKSVMDATVTDANDVIVLGG